MNSKNKRKWHSNFKKYVDFMVKHKNYEGLFVKKNKDGEIGWVITGESIKGQERKEWWNNQCNKHGIKIEAGCYAKVAAKIHPTKLHVCQICGKSLSVEYIYPNKRTLKLIKENFEKEIKPFSKDIFDIIDTVVETNEDIEKIKSILKIDTDVNLSKSDLKKYVQLNIVEKSKKGALSPGVMSNSPDRFDGYHSDGACCRHESDKGRHKTNLQRYGQDRRVYENWADGNWKMADRLMSEFRKHGVSADHIGPISLGFCHRPKFHPLSKEENSSKNNRMSLDDVEVLLQDENKDQVVSWHSQFIWDKLKNKVKTDRDAVKLSDLMRKNLHQILIIFSMIDENGHRDFLENFLNPEYSYFDYSFVGFDVETGSYEKVVTRKLTGKNQKNNTKRYYRIAFEKLQEYKNVQNRKTNIWKNKEIDNKITDLLISLERKQYKKAKYQIDKIFLILAHDAYLVFKK